MMEAFVDEQNTLIRPLVNRKLLLVRVLDERVSFIEKILEEKRRKLSLSTPMNRRALNAALQSEELTLIERLEGDLEQLSEEKVQICYQLMDLVRRPYETICEVESALETALGGVPHAGDDIMIQPPPTQPTRSARQTATAVKAEASPPPPVVEARAAELAPPAVPVDPSELWCYCRQPDDGREMVACDNARCSLQWWHIDCVHHYVSDHQIGGAPSSNGTWQCPICVASEMVDSTKKKTRKGGIYH